MRHRDTQAKKYMCIQFRTLSHIDFSVSTNKDKCFVQTDRMNRNLTKKKSLFFPFFHCRISLFSVIIFYLVWLLFASHIFVCTTLNDMVYVFYTLECILYVYKYIFLFAKLNDTYSTGISCIVHIYFSRCLYSTVNICR